MGSMRSIGSWVPFGSRGGVGGVGSADQAYQKIRAGASAIQLYTALVFGGISLASDIATGLDALLERDGFANIADAVGTGCTDWT